LIPVVALCGALALPSIAQDKKDEKPPAQEQKREALKVGATVDEKVALTDLDGKAIDFKSLRGKVVILHFWSDRCPAEKHANPVFKSLEKYYEGKNVVMLGICSNTATEFGEAPPKDADPKQHYGNFRKQIKDVGFTHTIIADADNKLSDMFAARTTPHCFVIDAKGVLVYAGALDDDQRGSKGDAAKVHVRDAADAALAGKPVEVSTTSPYG
jgi:thiol-disulfide isomerase/thioredoxin